jgi:signal transduction histidine kinase
MLISIPVEEIHIVEERNPEICRLRESGGIICISHGIIKRHGGALMVKSQKGKGNIFQLALTIEAV